MAKRLDSKIYPLAYVTGPKFSKTKDRYYVNIWFPETKVCLSMLYSRYLMQEYLERELSSDECVDHKDENALNIGEAHLLPEVGSLFEPKILFRQVVLSGVSLPAELVAELPRLFASLALPASRFGLENIRLEKTELSFAGLVLEGLEGEVQRDAKGLFQGVQLNSADRGTKLEAKPVGAGLEVKLDALA